MDEHERISLVLPTYNRAEALRTNLGVMLAMRGVAEVIDQPPRRTWWMHTGCPIAEPRCQRYAGRA